jgi:hypothetical protein
MSLFDLAPAVNMLSSGTISVARRDVTSYSLDGVANPVTYSVTFSCRGSVQPTPGEDIKKLPEGEDYDGAINIWAARDLKITDIVTWRGEQYRVVSSRLWTQLGNYSESVAVRV